MYVDFLTLFVPAAIVFSVILAAVATWRVRGDRSFTPEQRAAQLALVWLVPVFGAALLLSVLRDEPRVERGSNATARIGSRG